MIEIVTYANKDFGLLQKLLNNEFNVNVRLLGWGTKWNGYDDKSKGLLKYLDTKNDNDIVVFVDGFDSLINKPIGELATLFDSYDCKVLLSNSPDTLFIENIFGTCKDGFVANAGMYMGYVEYLKIVLKDTLSMSCSDDQVKMNKLCKIHPFIKVDTREVIFKNIPANRTLEEGCNALFVSYPGAMSVERWSRAIPEYMQFFFKEIVAVLLVAIWFLPKLRKQLCVIGLVLTLYYVGFADKTCV